MLSKGDRVRDVTWPDKHGYVIQYCITKLDRNGNAVSEAQIKWDDGSASWRNADAVVLIQGHSTVIGLTGYARTGKDTVADILVKEHGYKRVAFADALREGLYTLDPVVHSDAWYDGQILRTVERRLSYLVDRYGWESTKENSPEVRRLLGVFGTDVGRMLLGDDVWLNIAAKKMVERGHYVITDVRFPNEVDFVRNMGGTVMRVTRPNVGPINQYDQQLDEYTFREIKNDGSIAALADKAHALAKVKQ